MRVPFSFILTFVVVGVSMVAILTGVRWNLNVVLIYISFMAREW
jgi:multisubunit Na+/H+ antiporter MnhC subunit